MHTYKYQVADAAKDAACILRAGSGCIVTTQNGIDAPTEAAAASDGESSVLAGIVQVIAFREDPAEGPLRCVRLGAPSPKSITLGECVWGGAGFESQRVLLLRDILKSSGVEVPVPEEGVYICTL